MTEEQRIASKKEDQRKIKDEDQKGRSKEDQKKRLKQGIVESCRARAGHKDRSNRIRLSYNDRLGGAYI